MKAAVLYITLLFGLFPLSDLNAQQLFLPPACYDVGIAPRYLISADFNNDGKPDIASADWAGGTASVILGNGNGTFQSPNTYPVGNSIQTLCAGDFNSDNKLDLAVSSYNTNELVLLWGQGNGQFTQGPVISLPEPFCTQSGDFNQDGNADIAVSLSAELKIAILSGDGTGGFTIQKFNCGGSGFPRAMVKADFDKDGKTDLAVGNWMSGLALLKGDGFGGFIVSDSIDNGQANIKALSVSDINNDGNLDLLFAQSSIVGYKYIDANMKFDHVNSPIYGIWSGGGNINGICVADFNDDGMLDIASSRQPSDSFCVNIGVSGFIDSFVLEAKNYYASCGQMTYGMLTADFNNDGHADLAASNEGGSNVSIFMNKLTAPNSLPQLELEADGVIVYPNPANTILHIKTERTEKRELYSSTGVLQHETDGNVIDISRLANGVYYLKSGNRVRKVVVE